MEKKLTNNTFKLIYFSANLNPFTFLSDLGKKNRERNYLGTKLAGAFV
jgi:hypothetical protein